MNFSLIVCTYKRHESLVKLLNSVSSQKLHPNQILIIDGSPDAHTKDVFDNNQYDKVEYFRVDKNDRGLTKQRNFGIKKVAEESEIVCFLDDDIVLKEDYFSELLNTYIEYPDAIGVSGYILEGVEWSKIDSTTSIEEFEFDGWRRKLGSRNILRKKLGLLSDVHPGYMPEFSNGFSTGFLPPSGKIYPVEYFMGGVASYRKGLFEKIGFSTYFEGYGLYEDMDFCLRASRIGKLYVNTNAQLFHFHESGGRPNKFKYGKMVIRNGWYVWRVKYKSPTLKAKFKWHSIALVLTVVRLMNTLNTNQKKEAITEGMGRIAGWWSLIWDRPKVQM